MCRGACTRNGAAAFLYILWACTNKSGRRRPGRTRPREAFGRLAAAAVLARQEEE